MTDTPTAAGPPRHLSLGGAAAAVAGLALFVYFVQRAGLGEITAGIQRLGWVFLVVTALAGLRFAARGMAWRHCLDGPHRLSPGRAFRAVVAGDMLGNLTPLGILVGEPAKSLFAADREPVSRTLPALAVENLFYTLSAALLIAGGGLALVLRLPATDRWWLAGAGLITVLTLLVTAAHTVIWRRIHVASGVFAAAAPLAPRFVGQWTSRVRRLEDRVFALYPRQPGRLLWMAGWELSFHVLAILEIYVILTLVTPVSPTLLDAVVFEAANRFINVVFKVVPLRLGVDEAGTAAVATWLGFGAAAGVTLAIVRKARVLAWVAVGTAFLLQRGLPVNRIITDAAAARAGANREQG